MILSYDSTNLLLLFIYNCDLEFMIFLCEIMIIYKLKVDIKITQNDYLC